MAEMPNDQALIRLAKQGCADSFGQLARRYQVPLLHFLRQRAETADAEDLVQETFIRAYTHIESYCETWCFSTWLFTIARRLWLNHNRRRRPVANSKALHGISDDSPDPSRRMAEEDQRKLLWEIAAKALDERQYTALWLYYVEGMSVQQIAQVLGSSRVALKTMLYRARKKLRPAIEATSLGQGAQQRGNSRSPSTCPTQAECSHG